MSPQHMRQMRTKVKRSTQLRIFLQTIRMVPEKNNAEHSIIPKERREIPKEPMSSLSSGHLHGKSQRLVWTISPTSMRKLGTERKLRVRTTLLVQT